MENRNFISLYFLEEAAVEEAKPEEVPETEPAAAEPTGEGEEGEAPAPTEGGEEAAPEQES